MKKYIKILLLIVWMGVIFYLSCESKDDSTHTTNLIVNTIYYIYGLFAGKNILDINSFTDLVFKPIRKLAHFSEFGILGILLYSVYNDTPKKNRIILPLILSGLYAISDEMHQYFVPGRACAFIDVIIDTCGAFIGIVLIHLIEKRWKERKQ